MPYAQVLNTASVASTSGGTFADTLVANTNDSLAVANFNTGGARWLEAWGIDSLHVAELEAFYTRPEATHDQQHGIRFNIQAAAFNTVGHVGEVSLLGGKDVVNVFKSDTLSLIATTTASDCIAFSWLTEYDDLPGASAMFTTPAQVAALHKSRVGIACNAVASGTAGAYGTSRAINADDDRLHANTWYAILGVNVQTDVLTVSMLGPDWGGQRIGLPAGAIEIKSSSFFLDQSDKWNKPLIPCFNSNNKGNTLVQVCDSAASTNPKIDIQMVELTGYPGV
jgi:hypothetical protein